MNENVNLCEILKDCPKNRRLNYEIDKRKSERAIADYKGIRRRKDNTDV